MPRQTPHHVEHFSLNGLGKWGERAQMGFFVLCVVRRTVRHCFRTRSLGLIQKGYTTWFECPQGRIRRCCWGWHRDAEGREKGRWQSGKGIMTRAMENAPMDHRSMPTVFLQFDLLSLSCFQRLVAANRWGSGAHTPTSSGSWMWRYWSNICNLSRNFPICGSCGTSSFEVDDPHHPMV